MLTLLVLVFFAVFAVSALLLTASRTGASALSASIRVVNTAITSGRSG